MKNTKAIVIAVISIFLFSCNENNDNNNKNTPITETKPLVQVPNFNADNAYQNIATQVAFGPRVPNTPAQLNCAKWMQEQLNQYCDTVFRQETTLTAGDGKTKLRCINLIGSIHPEAKGRILLLAHWDTRPWADNDTHDTHKPIDGADDGGSGVGVLLEVARLVSENNLPNENLGIDILFTDVEDYGKSEWENSFALGTRYWVNNPHTPGYTAKAGILLDMVGAKNAVFAMEGYSMQYANHVLQDVWTAARSAGFSSYFLYQRGGSIEDDHVPVNQILKIPTIDIIYMQPGSQTGFGAHWHTHNDNLDIIDRNTLKAVGQTVLQYLYTR